MSVDRVRKRDGREVPFDEGKIRDAIHRAMVAVGEGDLGFASEVAGVVRLALQNRRSDPGAEAGVESRTPGIEEIQDLVEHALIELGRASVAKAYILYRDRRAKVREVLEVHRSPQPGSRAPKVRPSEDGASTAWSKGRIVAALMNEAELGRSVAEVIAASVETRVFALGQKHISTALVRELVDNELVGMGLDAALRRQASVLVPVHDLRQRLQTPPRPWDAAHAITPEDLADADAGRRAGGELLRRFSIDHVLDDASAERHLSGELSVVDLAQPHLYLWAGLPSDLFATADFDEGSAFATLAEVAQAIQATSQGVVIESAQTLLAPLARARAAKRGDPLVHWLRAAGACGAAGGRRVELCFDADRNADVLERTVDALAGCVGDGHLPRVFVDERALESLYLARRDLPERALALERLLESRHLVPTWAGSEERFAAPGCQRGARERGAIYCAGAVALNLPRLALRAGPWREDSLLEALAQSVADAIAALEGLAAFQSSMRGARRGELRGRVGYALTPVGLREALAVLGDGEIRPEQGARILGLIHDVARRAGAARGLGLCVAAFFGERAAQRFAEIDASAPQVQQRLLFGDGSRFEAGRAYTAGLRLTPAPGFVPWAAEAQLLSTLPIGALHPLPEERSRGGLLSLAESSTRFSRLRREPPGRSEAPPTRPPAPRETAGLFDHMAPTAGAPAADGQHS